MNINGIKKLKVADEGCLLNLISYLQCSIRIFSVLKLMLFVFYSKTKTSWHLWTGHKK